MKIPRWDPEYGVLVFAMAMGLPGLAALWLLRERPWFTLETGAVVLGVAILVGLGWMHERGRKNRARTTPR